MRDTMFYKNHVGNCSRTNEQVTVNRIYPETVNSMLRQPLLDSFGFLATNLGGVIINDNPI